MLHSTTTARFESSSPGRFTRVSVQTPAGEIEARLSKYGNWELRVRHDQETHWRLACTGSIEIAKVEKRRNADLHYYRAVEMPNYSEEDIAAMTPEERQATAGLIVQHATAEIMAALAAGKLNNDPSVCLAWRWFNLDEQGRQDLAEEQVRWWERTQEIEAESTNRRAESGEDATSMLITQFGYERARKGHKFPPS
jgi:hypothetical protein